MSKLDIRIHVIIFMFIPLAIHAIHGSCILYTWCLYIWESPKTFQEPPPDWMADCKARARRWCGCTSAGVDPPRPGIRTNGKDMIKANQFGRRKRKSAKHFTLAHVQKHALNYCHKNPLPHSVRPSSPPPFLRVGQAQVGTS